MLATEELSLLLRPRPERYEILTNRNRIIIGLLVYQGLLVREIGEVEKFHPLCDMEQATVRVLPTSKTDARKQRPHAAKVKRFTSAYLNEDRQQFFWQV